MKKISRQILNITRAIAFYHISVGRPFPSAQLNQSTRLIRLNSRTEVANLYTNHTRGRGIEEQSPAGKEESQMNMLIRKPTNACRSRKFSDAKLVELHAHGLSIPKLAKELGVSQHPVRKRMCKLGLKANWKRGGVPRYERVGRRAFRCRICKRVKPLYQRNGTMCRSCSHHRWVSTTKGALRFRYCMKRFVARRKGIPFTLTFEDYTRVFDLQAGRDAYIGEQMCFDFGQGRSAETASLDRIDNDGGYTPGNVVFCRLDTNSKKNDQPKDQFMKQLALEFPEGGSISLG
jgi:hypothetical protein